MAHAAASAPQPSLGSIDISILERTAEDISSAASAAGSDIGSEIRKMMSAERERERSRSRSASQSSSSHHNTQIQQSDPNILTRPRRISSNRSRATSNSYANSVSDARLGITSPVESVRSAGSWSHQRGPQRGAMESSIIHSSAPFEPTHEPLQEGRPLDSPLAPSASIRSGASQYSSSYSQDHSISRRVSQSSLAASYSQGMSRQASQSSFAMRYDQMAGQIEEQLQTIPHTPEPEAVEEGEGERYRQGYQQQYHHHQQEQGQHSRQVVDTPDRPHSTDTFQEAQLAFKDFDGVHFNPATEEFVAIDEQGNEVRRVSARTSSGSLLDAAQVLRTPRARPMSYGAGTVMSGYDNGPQEGMVYYPAPVPRMLNLPKRFSQQPAPSTTAQAKRQTQLLNYERDNHMSKDEPAPFIPKLDFDDGNNDTEETTRNRSVSQPLPSSTTQDKEPQFRGLMNQQHQRRSTAHMSSNLPPQLRASIYFEHQPITQDVQIDRKHQSVVATLDSILAASATAPVSAFVDHFYAGDVRKSVYATEKPTHTRKNTSTQLLESERAKALKKKRSSSIGNFFRRSSGDLLLEGEGGAKRPGSRGSGMLDGGSEAGGGRKLQKRKSQLSMADAMERERTLLELEGIQTPEEPQTSSGLVDRAANTTVMPSEVDALIGDFASPVPDGNGKVYTDAEQIAQDFAEQDALSDVSDTDPIFAQPATLLAELQVRKAQMKSRVKGHAVKYPNGMHSTLLQLDAVEQINKQKRAKQKIALAWEDPHQNQLDEVVNEEDDVPLGVLYPSEKPGQRRAGGGKALGLMEMREMEDTEPLRRRAERLNPGRYPPRLQQRPGQGMRRGSSNQMLMSGALPEGEGEDMLLEGETLGQRARRMKDREALDGAIVDVVAKPGDRPISTFSADVLSQFGGLDVKDAAAETTGAAAAATTEGEEGGEEQVEEETLGQRRARLQRERSVSGDAAAAPSSSQQQTGGERPPVLRSTNSMANLLSSNPVGSRERARAWEERTSHQQGLLQVSAKNQARQKMELRNTNMGRSSSMGFGGPPPPPPEQRQSIAAVGMGLMGGVQARPTQGAFVPTAGAGVGFASPTAGYGMGGIGGQQQINPGAYYQLAGGRVSLLPPGQIPMGGYSTTGVPMMGMLGGYQQQQMGGGMGMPMMGYHPQQPQMGMGGYNSGMNGMGAMGMSAMGINGMNGMELPLDPNQRAAIDRWRMGIGA